MKQYVFNIAVIKFKATLSNIVVEINIFDVKVWWMFGKIFEIQIRGIIELTNCILWFSLSYQLLSKVLEFTIR